MIQKPFKLFNKHKDPIRGDVSYPDMNRRYPVLILCHGFKGFKDWGFFPYVAEMLCKKGFIVVKFNFSGSGIGEDLQNFTDLERFATNTYSRELDDLDRVLEELEKGNVCGKQGYLDRVGILGHSRGGGMAVLKAAFDNRIHVVVTWSAISHVDRKSFLDIMPQWKRQGNTEIQNSRTGQWMRLDLDIVEDIEKNGKSKLHILKTASKLDTPYLLVHGDKDESVPVGESRSIFEALRVSRSRLEIIPGASHTYNCVHPFTGPTPELKRALSATQEWFKNFLK
ncbi:MAG: prolyl oligopeptidase family serine peptidase [Bacteroidetes bacterium]|nr:prolyl oligopeptidase family serine peptidase [Bacteroidota bacterium]